MHIGMTYEQYWNADPYLAVYYRKAHELKVEERNQELWLQGLYNYKAFSAVIDMFAYGLGGKKGRRPKGYIEKPIDLKEPGKQPESELEYVPTEAEEEKAKEKVIEQLNQWAKMFKSKTTPIKSGDKNGS